MKGLWITPDWETYEVNNTEHIDFAKQQGWLDNEKVTDIESDEYYPWVQRKLNQLYDDGFIKARYYEPNQDDDGDIVFHGHQRFLTPEIIQYVLQHYGLPLEMTFTIETGNDETLLHRGSLNEWHEMYEKKLKPLTGKKILLRRMQDAPLKIKPVDKE